MREMVNTKVFTRSEVEQVNNPSKSLAEDGGDPKNGSTLQKSGMLTDEKQQSLNTYLEH